MFDKILLFTKTFLLEINLLMFLGDFIFVVLNLEIHPAVHLNASKARMSL